jgi:hypothetical protein
MKIVAAAALGLMIASGVGIPAQAKGCLKGAAVGGVAGHMAGHHGVLGAAAGCAVGHHEANKNTAEHAQSDSDNHGGTPTDNR